MTKEEMQKKFMELTIERIALENTVRSKYDISELESLSREEKYSIVNQFVDNAIKTVDLIGKYMLEQIQPCSYISEVWFAYVFDFLSNNFRQTFDEDQKKLFAHIGDMMLGADTAFFVVKDKTENGGTDDE